MLQHLPSLPIVVGFLVAFVASFSRIFSATRAFWSRFPAWFQMLAPQLALALGALGQGLAGGVQSWTDLTVVFIGAAALLLPGLPSNRSAAPLQAGKAPKLSPSAGDQAVAAVIAKKKSVPPPSDETTPPWGGPASTGAALLLAICFAFHVTGCGLLAAASPYLAEAGVLIADAANAVNAADDLLPSLHLTGDAETKAEAAVARARKALASAAAADNGAKDLTEDQLDASLAEFRAAWGDLKAVFASASPTAAAANPLPAPLAMRRVYK